MKINLVILLKALEKKRDMCCAVLFYCIYDAYVLDSVLSFLLAEREDGGLAYAFLFIDITWSDFSYLLYHDLKYFCSWHDKAFLFEQHHWKKARAKKQPYKFKVWLTWLLVKSKKVLWNLFQIAYIKCTYPCPHELFSFLLQWNQQDKQIRESYYNNWADYFP